MRRKILLFHRSLKQSGAARQLVNLYRGLDRDRFDPFFVLEYDRKIFRGHDLEGARVLTLGTRKRRQVEQPVDALLEIIDAERPDLIQSFNHRANRYLYKAASRRRIPPFFTSIRNTEQPAKNLIHEVWAQRRHRGLVVNSRRIRRQLVRVGLWPGRIHVIPNGVDIGAFRPGEEREREALRRSLGVAPDDFVILAVGRVAPQKSLATTLRAVGRLARDGMQVRFVNVGLNHKPEYRRELEQVVAEEGIGSLCSFHEPVKQVVEFYRAADAMVLASHYEGLPNVVLENMACGGLSVVSSQADTDSIVQPGDTGFRFRVGREDELVRCLRTIHEMDPGARRLMGERARKDVSERFSMARMVRSFEALYDRELARA